jgi:hypothetical protein
VTTSNITVRGRVPGIDQDEFEKYAQGAAENCPISRALGGVDISVDAKLEDGDGGSDSSDDESDSDSDSDSNDEE